MIEKESKRAGADPHNLLPDASGFANISSSKYQRLPASMQSLCLDFIANYENCLRSFDLLTTSKRTVDPDTLDYNYKD